MCWLYTSTAFGFTSKYSWKLLCTWRDWSSLLVYAGTSAISAKTTTCGNSWLIQHFLHFLHFHRRRWLCTAVRLGHTYLSRNFGSIIAESFFDEEATITRKQIKSLAPVYIVNKCMAFNANEFNLNSCRRFRVIIIYQSKQFNDDPPTHSHTVHITGRISHFPEKECMRMAEWKIPFWAHNQISWSLQFDDGQVKNNVLYFSHLWQWQMGETCMTRARMLCMQLPTITAPCHHTFSKLLSNGNGEDKNNSSQPE